MRWSYSTANSRGHDIDAVITTRELVKMIRSAHISPETSTEIESDSPMHDGTGAGVIFGATGGVMEAALRSAYYLIKKENPPADAFRAVRSEGFGANEGVQEGEIPNRRYYSPDGCRQWAWKYETAPGENRARRGPLRLRRGYGMSRRLRRRRRTADPRR